MSIKQARELVNAYLANDIPVFMWGAPGVGKSDSVRSIADERKWNVIDFRCSTRDPVALMGLPDVAGETTRWKVPDEFPQVGRDGEEGILFLDELNTAAPSMQAAAFGLVLDKRVGEYTLPSGWRIIAAGNRQSDKAAAQRMPSALANRFAHIDVEPNVDDFVEWGNKNDIDPMVVAFVRWRPGLLHDMKGENLRAFPTPRAWAKVSKVCQAPTHMRMALVTGLIGEGAAAEFEGFVRLHKDLPSLDKVLMDPKNTKVPQEPAAKYAICSGLARKVDPKTFGNAIIYAGRMPREFSVMMVTDAVRRDNALSHTDAFTQWAVDNRDVTIG